MKKFDRKPENLQKKIQRPKKCINIMMPGHSCNVFLRWPPSVVLLVLSTFPHWWFLQPMLIAQMSSDWLALVAVTVLEPVVSSQPPTQTETDTLTKYVKIFNSYEEELLRRKTIQKLLKISADCAKWTEGYACCCSPSPWPPSTCSPHPSRYFPGIIPLKLCKKAIFVWNQAILESCLISRSFRLLSSHLDQDELLASAKMTSPVIGLAIGILATSLLQVSYCICICPSASPPSTADCVVAYILPVLDNRNALLRSPPPPPPPSSLPWSPLEPSLFSRWSSPIAS